MQRSAYRETVKTVALFKTRKFTMKNATKNSNQYGSNTTVAGEKTSIQKTVKEVCGENHAQTTPHLQLLTFAEVAAVLRVSARTVRRLVESGELACVYIRSSPRIREVDVERYLNTTTESAYNDHRVGLDVRSQGGEKRTCQNATIKTVSIVDPIFRTVI
jgi:excisionase family DNA binding protein